MLLLLIFSLHQTMLPGPGKIFDAASNDGQLGLRTDGLIFPYTVRARLYFGKDT